MKDTYLTKEKYWNEYSFIFLISSLCLVLPMRVAISLFRFCDSFELVCLTALFGTFAWLYVFSATYLIACPLEVRVAVDILSMGFMAMLLLCVILISSKQTSLTDPLEAYPSGIAEQSLASFDLKEAEETYLEQLRLCREEIKREGL